MTGLLNIEGEQFIYKDSVIDYDFYISWSRDNKQGSSRVVNIAKSLENPLLSFVEHRKSQELPKSDFTIKFRNFGISRFEIFWDRNLKIPEKCHPIFGPSPGCLNDRYCKIRSA